MKKKLIFFTLLILLIIISGCARGHNKNIDPINSQNGNEIYTGDDKFYRLGVVNWLGLDGLILQP